VADCHHMRLRCLYLLGASTSRDLAQARYGLSHTGCLQFCGTCLHRVGCGQAGVVRRLGAWISLRDTQPSGRTCIVGDKPARRSNGQDARARRHLFPRHHRLLDRHAGYSQARDVPRGECFILERRLYRHQWTLLDAWLARVVELVARTSDLELRRAYSCVNIKTYLQSRW